MVNVDANVVTVYQNGVPVRAMVCSTGDVTPRAGTFLMSDKYRWHDLYGNVYGQYTCRITGHILFHSLPYVRNYDPSSMISEEFDKLGTPASMGCVRLMTADAKWIYENCDSGTSVTFYADAANPGPLGRPFTAPVSSFAALYGWDPTDPDPMNPWNTFLGTAFDAQYYLAANPDLLEITPYWNETTLRLHYLTVGINEGRKASEWFAVNDYKSAHEDLKDALGDNNYAYIQNYNAMVMQEAAAFDANFYMMTYPDIAELYSNDPESLRMHYITYGLAEGRQGHI